MAKKPVKYHESGFPPKRLDLELRENGFFKILRETKGRYPAILAFRELLNIAEGRQVF